MRIWTLFGVVLIICTVEAFPSIKLEFGKSVDGREIMPESFTFQQWIPAGQNDYRGPCPALNTLANHGYLPRSGMSITKEILTNATYSVFRLAPEFSAVLFDDAYNRTGHTEGGVEMIDLKGLRNHNELEHDFSITRYDYGDAGKDNFTPQPTLVNQLKSFAVDGVLDLTSCTKARLLRIQQEKKSDPKYYSDDRLDDLGIAESFLIFRFLGTGKVLPVRWADTWFLKEQIPSDWEIPSSVYGFPQFGADLKLAHSCIDLLYSGRSHCKDQ
jgi:hypothetical protein